MNKIYFKIEDDAVIKYTAMPEMGENVYKNEVVMTKEIFQECYKKWVEPQESSDMNVIVKSNVSLDKLKERISLEKLGYPPSAGYYKAIMKVLQIIDGYEDISREVIHGCYDCKYHENCPYHDSCTGLDTGKSKWELKE